MVGGAYRIVDKVDLLNYRGGIHTVPPGHFGGGILKTAAVTFFKPGDNLIGKNLTTGTGYNSKICRVGVIHGYPSFAQGALVFKYGILPL
jgi:hypothetical protein